MALISDYKDGGLEMPHIESVVKTQRILCVKRFLDERDSPWKKFPSYYLKDVGSAFFLQCKVIYSCRSKNVKPRLTLFQIKVREVYKIELMISKKNQREITNYEKL